MKEFKKALEKALELLPDWAQGKKIILTANQELVAKRDPESELKVKAVRCNYCSECCLEVPDDYLSFGTNGEGKCNKLGENGKCEAGHQKPFSCIDDPPESAFKDLNCKIEYI